MTDIAARLEDLRDRGLYRRLRLIEGPQGPRVMLGGDEVLLLCSNNYLGLADHPRVREAAAEAAMQWGAGAGAARLISGNMAPHTELESRLAAVAALRKAADHFDPASLDPAPLDPAHTEPAPAKVGRHAAGQSR